MPQVPVVNGQSDMAVDYTPASAVSGGDVIVLNGLVGVATSDIAANEQGSLSVEGIKKVPKTTAAWTVGLPVHWNPTGDPDGGSAGSGAANQLGVGTYMGIAALAAASGDDFGYVRLNHPQTLRAVTTVAAAGSVIGDAAALSQGINIVTGADGTKGVILPVARPGAEVIIKGTTAGVLKIYPQSGSTINALSASAAMSLSSGAIPAILIATSATQWYTIPLVPS